MKTVFKKDHYETQVVLDCFNCKVLQSDTQFTFLKVEETLLKQLENLKREITGIVNRNPEFYCDCKKIIKNDKTFEETLKVNNNDFKFEIGKNYNLKLLIYSIWIGKSSYGPLLKVIESNQIETEINSNFLQESDSDEEIQNHFDNFNLKNNFVKKRRKSL